MVTDYLNKAGLQDPLNQIGFDLERLFGFWRIGLLYVLSGDTGDEATMSALGVTFVPLDDEMRQRLGLDTGDTNVDLASK